MESDYQEYLQGEYDAIMRQKAREAEIHPRQLNEWGYDIVRIEVCVWKGDSADYLSCQVTERNTSLNKGEGAQWTNHQAVPLQYARIGQSLWMRAFTEHVMQYAETLR